MYGCSIGIRRGLFVRLPFIWSWVIDLTEEYCKLSLVNFGVYGNRFTDQVFNLLIVRNVASNSQRFVSGFSQPLGRGLDGLLLRRLFHDLFLFYDTKVNRTGGTTVIQDTDLPAIFTGWTAGVAQGEE
jgi:hypothetical protein